MGPTQRIQRLLPQQVFVKADRCQGSLPLYRADRCDTGMWHMQ